MDNLVLMKKSSDVEELSFKLGFSRTLFLDTHCVIINNGTASSILRQANAGKAKKLITLFKPLTEQQLRFVLEKTPVDMVYGLEQIHFHDSVHFLRGGLDQVLCKIAAQHHKTIGFSFQEILAASGKAELLARMAFNIKLCRKYNINLFWSTFAQEKWELRSADDLASFWRMLGGTGKEAFTLQNYRKAYK